MAWASNPEIWVALVTLTVLELVLGIANIIFISILAGKLPEEQRGRARVVGLGWRCSPGSCCSSRSPGWRT